MLLPRQLLFTSLRVVVLLCLLGSGWSQKITKAVYRYSDDHDNSAEANQWKQTEELGAADLGYGPWLGYSPEFEDAPAVVEPSQPVKLVLEHQELTPEQAAAILERVKAAAAHGGWNPDIEIDEDDEGIAEPPTSLEAHLDSAADASIGDLGTFADAASMPFAGISSMQAEAQLPPVTPAPPFLQPQPPPPQLAPRAPHEAAEAQLPGGYTPPPPEAFMFAPAPAPAPASSSQSPTPAPPFLAADPEPPETAPSLAPTPAPPFTAADAATQAPSEVHVASQQQKKGGKDHIPVALMGRGYWMPHEKGGASFPTDPEVPPAWDVARPAAFCDPARGLEPTDSGRCVCMPGFGTNADMRTCSKCPIGWYSRGGQIGITFCKPCPQLSTSNPLRTACVQRRNVIRPNVPLSLCEPCIIPSQPFAPPVCCPRGQVCCGADGCCPSKRCFNNATTGFKPSCCGDDCNTGRQLNCCPGGQICVNSTGTSSQLCCGAGKVCGDTATKSCCGSSQDCCNAKECCNTGDDASPKQQCAPNNVTGPPANDRKCCLLSQINCNGTCCTTQDTPASQTCIIDNFGQARCCGRLQLCPSDDGVIQCCDQNLPVCVSNVTSTGATVRRCCQAGWSLCPKNNFQPICCIAGKCPSPSTADNCLP